MRHLLLCLCLLFSLKLTAQTLYCGYSAFTWNGTVLDTLWMEDEWVRSVELTNLTTVRYAAIYNNERLTNVNLSALKAHTGGNNYYLNVTYNPALVSLNLDALVSSSSVIAIVGNSNMTTLQLSKLVFVGNYLSVAANTSLTTLNLPALVHGGTVFLGFLASDCTSLTNVYFPKYLPSNGRMQNFDNCALTEGAVDHVLARCVASQSFVSGTVKLNGGTSASPSAVGLADVAILQARGVTVLHN